MSPMFSAVPAVAGEGAARLFAAMPAPAAADHLALADALADWMKLDGAGKARAAAALQKRFPRLQGLSVKSLYRKAAKVREGGAAALLRGGGSQKKRPGGPAASPDFREWWQQQLFRNRRARGKRASWLKLMRQLRAGESIPGIGTWRDLYLALHGVSPTPSETCPWDELSPPPGFSYCSLVRIAPSAHARLAAAVGPAAAALASAFTVRKTRVGLQCCQVVEVDDMWHEHKVLYAGNREPQRCIEFHAMDRLTGHLVCRLLKVNRERGDGSLETMRSLWARYVYHYLLCVEGVPPAGMTIDGEHGTMSADAVFANGLAAVNAWRASLGLGLVAFKAGALLPRALAKGLPDGPAKGNPRHKGMLEGFHALYKNALGDVLGEVGGGRGLEPEAAASEVAESRRLSGVAAALEARRPGIARRLQHPFLHFPDFAAASEEALRRIDSRLDHDLEGWTECGFAVQELQIAGDSLWRTVTPEKADAARARAEAGFAAVRARRMSPAEAWAASRSVLAPVPPFFAPLLLGAELSATATVSANLRFQFRAPESGDTLRVAAFADNTPLERGRQYRLWVNPLDPARAYVADLDGRFLGTAPVLDPARADADDSTPELQRQLALRSRALADFRRQLEPAVRDRLRQRNERAAANLAALGLDDPAAIPQPPAADAALARLASSANPDDDLF